MSPRPALVAALFALSAAYRAEAVIVTVGPDAACQYPTPQQAIDALPAGGSHEIRVMQGLYTAQALYIQGRFLTLRGSYPNCASAVANGSGSTLSGNGGVARSVVWITGPSNVLIEGFTIRAGDAGASGSGGGILFVGHGQVEVRNTTVTSNVAGYGGGIDVESTSSTSPARLVVGAGTLILTNVAQVSGGGIRAAGNSEVYVEPANVWIDGNEAIDGYGGGIAVINGAVAYLSSPGFLSGGLLTNNRARRGGGLAVVADDSRDTEAYLYSRDAQRPIRLSGNRATEAGGAVYVEGGPASVCARDFRFDANRAPEGAAIHVTGDFYVHANFNTCSEFEPPDRIACAVGAPCNLVDGNVAENASGTATAGALVRADGEATVALRKLRILRNRVGYITRTRDHTLLGDSVVAQNTVTNAFWLDGSPGGEFMYFRFVTLADNTITGPFVIRANNRLVLDHSILWQPGKVMLQQTAGDRQVGDLILSERASVDGFSDTTIGDSAPRFVDPGRDDYRQRIASPGVDFASALSVEALDADGALRGIDLALQVNRHGPIDLGAYERPSSYPIVLNGELNDDARHWNEATVNTSRWVSDQNVSGPAGSGSIFVDWSFADPRTTARVQCVHLPAPGRYRLNGFGRTSGVLGQRDSVVLAWEFRRVGGESCNAGPADLGGDHFLTNSTSWGRPATPATIDVTPQMFTTASSISVALVVLDNGLDRPRFATGWFDGITLEVEGLAQVDALFSNGFE